ncbi:hypothetical protein TARUN_7446 [Trichoderma arundinaceum]|uniref:Tat pathway signal sequence n=1 Tax=Trichoderma arundinaceum TaxID=490622 RepID=A0A395NFB4_TRIAR|nr:hypothetical protein TARUN_7446 [Trichoderma arundinaceum]
MERERDDSSIEELDPFLGSSLRSKDEIRNHRRHYILLYCLVALLGVSLGSHVLTYVYIHKASYRDATCVLHTQQNPTPIDIPIHYRSVLYDGTFLANSTSIYRLPPSPEVDAAWEGLGTTSKPLLLSKSQASHAGISPDHLKTPSGEFPVLFEFNHHLHCLNMIRKAVYFNYHYYSGPNSPGRHLGADEQTITKHVAHCIDMLRQVIQCKPDLGVFGQYWVTDKSQGVDGSFVDFNTDHKCIDWEPVQKWVQAHQTLEDIVVELREGDKILDVAP